MGYGSRWGYCWGNQSLAVILEDIIITPLASATGVTVGLRLSQSNFTVQPAFALKDVEVRPLACSALRMNSKLCFSHHDLSILAKTGLDQVSAASQLTVCLGNIGARPSASLVSIINTATDVL